MTPFLDDPQTLSGSQTPSSCRLVALIFALACTVAIAPIDARAVIQTNGGATGSRITSTASLTPAELAAFQLQGRFRSFLGTPIDANHFLTAQHIGISPTDTISFSQGPNAGTYSIQTWYDDSGSDLRIVRIAGTFNDWALVNAASDEAGKTATIFGRGGVPNGSVFVGAELKGWTAAGPDGLTSWGRNVITGTFGGYRLYARFERNGLPEEAGLSVGDSGGAWFVEDALGVLRLAGLSFAVSGPFQLDQGGAPDGVVFEAALFDIGGLWIGTPGSESFIPENPVDVPGVGFGTRVSDRTAWIESIVPISVGDADGDGVPDDQDNCPFVTNSDQLDTGGLGFEDTPDGIGNVCQCGDVTGEGQANDTDSVFIKRWALGLSSPLFLIPDNCDVTGEGTCNGTDATLIRHAAAGRSIPLFGQNCPNALP